MSEHPTRMKLASVGALVELAGAGVDLGGRPVLRDVDLALHPGEVVGVAGPNGSGKTTLLRTVATLLRLSHGSGHVLGADLARNDFRAIRPSIGMIGHRPALIQELTLRENLIHLARLGGEDVERVDPVLDVVGLAGASDRRATAASFGMQRRTEVAHLLLRRPDLVLLDEAISGLDGAAQDLVAALISRTTDEGGGVITVSHDQTRLSESCDRVLVLAAGRLEALP